MMVRVHRGGHEVGAAWVEITHEGDRLLLDAGVSGSPAHAEHAEQAEHGVTPTVLDIGSGSDARLRGVLDACPHLGRLGLVDRVSPQAPVFLGRQAAAIASASRSLTTSRASSTPITPAGYLEDRQPLHLGEFTITPQLIDHGGLDAFALVIDAGTERLVWAGALRGQGRDTTLFERLVANPPSGVDTLLIEGAPTIAARDLPTVLATDAAPHRPRVTEAQLEHDMAQTFLATDGLAVVLSGAQHMDRLVTAYRACLRSGRTLLVDLYAAAVARATGRASLPQPGFPQFGVHVPDRQRRALEAGGELHHLQGIAAHGIRLDEIISRADEFVILAAVPTVGELLRHEALDRNGVVVWSQGSAARRDAAGEAMSAELASAAVRLVEHHASGRPGAGDLSRLVAAVGARQVVALGDGAPGAVDRMSCPSRHTMTAPDGGWWEVAPTRARPVLGGLERSRMTA